MTGLGVLTLVLILYLAGEVVAIALGATIGKRVGVFRRVLIVVSIFTLGFLLLLGR